MKKTFFLKFATRASEDEFRKEIRMLNRIKYQVFVVERTDGIWEVHKLTPDPKGLSSYLLGTADLENSGDNVWDILMHKYSNPSMKDKVIFSWKEFECRQEAFRRKRDSSSSKAAKKSESYKSLELQTS